MRALVSSEASEPQRSCEPSGLNMAHGSSREIPGTTITCLPEETSQSTAGPAKFYCEDVCADRTEDPLGHGTFATAQRHYFLSTSRVPDACGSVV